MLDSPPTGTKLVPIREHRTLQAAPRRIWELLTTKEGFSSWWAPEGFVLTVEVFDPRTGGRIDLQYEEAGAARNPAWAAELRAKGQETSFAARGTFTEVEYCRRVAFRQTLDFGRPGAKQEYRMSAELTSVPGGRTRLALVSEATSSKHWKLLGAANLRAQLDRLAVQCESKPDRTSRV